MRRELFAYVLPTRNRHDALRETIASLASLGLDAPILVVDNGSDVPVALTGSECNAGAQVARLDHNAGAAGRNVGVELLAKRFEWVVMLDDDSAPIDAGFVHALHQASDEVGAVTADIFLTSGGREAGGLPEVPVGCGVAYRVGAFLDAGGYDPAFGYYAEEYDLSAKLIARGWRVRFDPRFRVEHRKVDAGRDMGRILGRLVRNSAWVMQRHAPEHERLARVREVVRRYHGIAGCEDAMGGFSGGLRELMRTRRSQGRTPLVGEEWDRFTGLWHARRALTSRAVAGEGPLAVVDRGKHDWCVDQALAEAGAHVVEREDEARAVVIGTMSPGPMLDAAERRGARGQRVLIPWECGLLAWDGATTSRAAGQHARVA